jgi:hypothetical protein
VKTLRAAAGLGATEAVGLAVAVLWTRGRAGVVLAAWLLVKVLFCVGAVRLGAGSFLAMVLYEVATVVGALAATTAPAAVRLTLAVSATTVLVLLFRSLRLFPEVKVP